MRRRRWSRSKSWAALQVSLSLRLLSLTPCDAPSVWQAATSSWSVVRCSSVGASLRLCLGAQHPVQAGGGQKHRLATTALLHVYAIRLASRGVLLLVRLCKFSSFLRFALCAS